MLVVTAAMAVWMLLRSGCAMDAASDACRLFVTSVMPGLMPYMAASLMLVSRVKQPCPGSLVMLLGWGGGSPTGARLLRTSSGLDRRIMRRTAVTCATMSPMFLVGTLGRWTGSARSAVCILAGVLGGGWLAGRCVRPGISAAMASAEAPSPLTFGQAVEQTMRTMLLICGTMVMMRVTAALLGEVLAGLPTLALTVTTLLEVTTGAQAIVLLPLPHPLRSAMLAAATGFGGAAIILQNRACYPDGLMRLPEQVLYQLVHAAGSFLVTLGLMLM